MTHFASASTEINESAMPAIRMRFPNHWCPIKLFEKRDFLCYNFPCKITTPGEGANF